MKSDSRAELVPMGDQALLVRFGETIDVHLNMRAQSLYHILRDNPPEGFVAASFAYASVLVEYDKRNTSFIRLKRKIRKILRCSLPGILGKEHAVTDIPVRYGGEEGPDLEEACRMTGLSREAFIEIHAGTPYRVYMMGFLPGFCYLGGLDGRIALPRLESPRKSIPAGSVGIGGAQTGIYSLESPGGWRIIGRTDVIMFDPAREKPFLVEPGDTIRFVNGSIV
ncbi:MAG: 5-oxoprolinase subunit PxpB [Clostridia bacterium]